jgi:hypothetical protein
MMLKDKVAVVYGAGGAVGGAVARAFAAEGAQIFVTGRSLASIEIVAKEIIAAGGLAEAAEVDALDEHAIDEHIHTVIDHAGRVDISSTRGTPERGDPRCAAGRARRRAVLPADPHPCSVVLPDRASGRPADDSERVGRDHVRDRSPSPRGIPLAGGYGPAQAVKEALTWGLSVEPTAEVLALHGHHWNRGPES